MTLQEIQTAVNAGQRVHFCEATYTVQKNVNGDEEEWNIVNADGDKMPLTWKDEKTLNGKSEDYFINPYDKYPPEKLYDIYIDFSITPLSLKTFAKTYDMVEEEAGMAIDAGRLIHFENVKRATEQKEGNLKFLLSGLEHVVNRLAVFLESDLTPSQRGFILGVSDHTKEVIKNVKP